MTRKEVIKAAMRDAGISQNQLAKKLGLSTQSAVANSVARNLSMDKLEKIMDAIGYEIVIRPKCNGTLPSEHKIGGEETWQEQREKAFEKDLLRKLVECIYNDKDKNTLILKIVAEFHRMDEKSRKLVVDFVRDLATF